MINRTCTHKQKEKDGKFNVLMEGDRCTCMVVKSICVHATMLT